MDISRSVPATYRRSSHFYNRRRKTKDEGVRAFVLRNWSLAGRILSSYCSLSAVAPINGIAYNSADARSIGRTQITDFLSFGGYFRPAGENNLQKKESTI